MHHGILVDFGRQFGGSLLLPCSSWGLHTVCQALQQYLYPWSHFATPLLEISEISGTFIAMKMPMIQLQTSFPPPCISFFLLFFCSFLWFRVCGKWACLCVFPCARCSCAHGICGAQRTALGCWSLPFHLETRSLRTVHPRSGRPASFFQFSRALGSRKHLLLLWACICVWDQNLGGQTCWVKNLYPLSHIPAPRAYLNCLFMG